jgi:hypothetical protein
MKSFSLLAIGALALAGAAYAQVPASNDTSSTDGNFNTGMGTGALGGPAATNGGAFNTASGYQALQSNTTNGNDNTASGYQALYSNTTGSANTASGVNALLSNTTGGNNTAAGYQALQNNTTGYYNTASGYEALQFNTTGGNNTAAGYQALQNNTTGSQNTAPGSYALDENTTGNYNTASGYEALFYNTTGNYNTASGVNALQHNTTGSSNIAVGLDAGANLTTGSNNIDIGSKGAAAESDTIRIGIAATHKATVIAGIYGTSVTGSAVVVSSTGRLGVTMSSERFKTAIAPMGANTAKLQQLRPVTFHLKTDPMGALQYGLIAEEVAKVYPELVIRNETGRIDGVRYDELAPMLLNEVQQQQKAATAQAEKVTALVEQNVAQAAEMRDLKQQQVRDRQQQLADLKDLKQELHAALSKLHAEEELVAQR